MSSPTVQAIISVGDGEGTRFPLKVVLSNHSRSELILELNKLKIQIARLDLEHLLAVLQQGVKLVGDE